MKTKIAITYGDPDGIGLEILNYLLFNALVPNNCHLKIFGKADLINISGNLKDLIEIETPNNLSSEAGKHSFQCLEAAAKACLNGECNGLITGPISKENWAKAGHKWKGQTEFLGYITQSKPEMLFIVNDWRILLLTRHIPISEVPKALTYERFDEATHVLKNFLLQKYKIHEPKIALAGLNPHAGENGEIGSEEKYYWNNWTKTLGLEGPFSPDDIWIRSSRDYIENKSQQYNAYLAPYHDQVLPLIKTITNFKAVNVSIGLPFPRTSPDHGTAFNLVGTGKANPIPFLEAIKLCVELI